MGGCGYTFSKSRVDRTGNIVCGLGVSRDSACLDTFFRQISTTDRTHARTGPDTRYFFRYFLLVLFSRQRRVPSHCSLRLMDVCNNATAPHRTTSPSRTSNQKNNAHMTLTRRAAVRIGRVESTSSVECGRAGETGGFILKLSNEHDGVLVLQDGTAKRVQGKPHRLASEGWVRARHSCSAACIPVRQTEHREGGRGRAARRLQQMSSAAAPSAQLTTPPAPLPSTKIR